MIQEWKVSDSDGLKCEGSKKCLSCLDTEAAAIRERTDDEEMKSGATDEGIIGIGRGF